MRRLVVMHLNLVVLAVTLIGFGAGIGATLIDDHAAASMVWTATTVLGIVLCGWWVVEAALERRLGADVIALLALLGTLVVGEHFAGSVITVMLTTGRSLEAWAGARAEREMHELLRHGPQIAHRYVNGALTTPPLDQVQVGDLLLVRPGEVVPVDGTVQVGTAIIDESALTGESVPVECGVGERVRGGAVNAGGPFDLMATTRAEDSTFAGIVRLVASATASTSPFVRLADRFAFVFLLLSVGVGSLAWVVSGEMSRAVAVLVVATPCPLILAAPVAVVAGMSRATRRGVVVKGGAALERLADGEILLFDKTGTLTTGRPALDEVVCAGERDASEVLRLAASLDQVSPHVLASAIVRAARERSLDLALPTTTEEVAGFGVRGSVEDHEVTLGKAAWVGIDGAEPWVVAARRRKEMDSALTVFVGIDGVPAGALVLTDPIRPDAARTIRSLRRAGIRRVVMATGDRSEVASAVGAMIGVDEVAAEQSPADKVALIRRESAAGPTIMVGDGVNDAPALALAGVGVALGVRGATASSEAADVVLTVDRLDRLGEARLIARRSRRIAAESVTAGMALSLAAMGVAAAGYLPAAWGAVLQELIDVSVILNALRALGPGRGEIRLAGSANEFALRFSAEHRDLHPNLDLLRVAADGLGPAPGRGAMETVRRAHRMLVTEIGPHEDAEDRHLYPLIASALGGADPTGTMSRTHAEVNRLTTSLGALIDRIGGELPGPEDVLELRRLLYGLHAILVLHFAQEEESYLSLAEDEPRAL